MVGALPGHELSFQLIPPPTTVQHWPRHLPNENPWGIVSLFLNADQFGKNINMDFLSLVIFSTQITIAKVDSDTRSSLEFWSIPWAAMMAVVHFRW